MRDRKADIAKFIGILLVVSCHANLPWLIEGRFFHMALFFFITGYLSEKSFDKPFKDFLISKIKSLYLPFLVAELVFIGLHNVFFNANMVMYHFHWNDFWLEIRHAFCFNNTEMMLSPLWFLPALFFTNLLSYGLKRIGTENQWLAASTVLGILGVMNVLPQINESRGFENGLNVVLTAQWLCCMGYRLRHVDPAQWFESFSGKCMAARAVVWLYVFNRWGLLTVDMRTNTYDPLVFWLIATGVGVYLVFFLAYWFNKVDWLAKGMAFAGKCSLYIFILHIFCFKLVCKAQVCWFGYDGEKLPTWENVSQELGWELVYIAAGMTLPIVLCILVEKAKFLVNRKKQPRQA